MISISLCAKWCEDNPDLKTLFTWGSIDIVVSNIAPKFFACGEGLIMSVPKRRGVGIVVDYSLRINREARSCLCLVLVCQDGHPLMSDRHSSILLVNSMSLFVEKEIYN